MSLNVATENPIDSASSPAGDEAEAWYDAEIAPALAELAKRCQARGMSFAAFVEYRPGERGDTMFLAEQVSLPMQMLCLAAQTVPNVDRYILSVDKLCKSKGVDTGSSIYLSR